MKQVNSTSPASSNTPAGPVGGGANGQQVQELRAQLKEELGLDDEQLAELGEQLGVNVNDPKQLQELLQAVQMLNQSGPSPAEAGSEVGGEEGSSSNPVNDPNSMGPLQNILDPDMLEQLGEYIKQIQESGGAAGSGARQGGTSGATPAAA